MKLFTFPLIFRAIVIFMALQFTSVSHGQVYERLVSFAETLSEGGNLGQGPLAAMVQDRDGNFYGTTSVGGTQGFGTIFKMTPAGTLTTLVNFSSLSDVCSNLVRGRDGNFYGTIQGNGSDYGAVFRMTPSGAMTTLVNFTGTAGAKAGANPKSGLVELSNGHFYGTTERGGASNKGTVFKITTNGTPAGTTFTSLVQFSGINGDNAENPATSNKAQGNLLLAADGNLYGVTQLGGTFGKGTMFRMTPAGVLTTLVNFTGSAGMGSFPKAGLLQRGDGSFYGTTFAGGTTENGTIFKVTTNGTLSGTVLTTLVQFTGNQAPNHGSSPLGTLIQGSDGNLYGTTYSVTLDLQQFGQGTVFKMTPAGVLTTLATFNRNNGALPAAGLVLGGDGNFYGTTLAGGSIGYGTIFKLTPTGVLTTLVNFTGSGETGSEPEAGLFEHTDGNFYGTTVEGGTSDLGTVFKMSSSGDLTTMGTFYGFSGSGVVNGEAPRGGVFRGVDANLYGGTNSSIFRLNPDGSPSTVALTYTLNQGRSYGNLAQDPAGNFYGTVYSDGTAGLGSIFRSTPAGALTKLVEFTGNGTSNKGANPLAGLVYGSDGSFYGTSSLGGESGLGTIFKLTTDGTPSGTTLTTLLEFNGDRGPPTALNFDNTTPITINDHTIANPYPSQIVVPNGLGKIAKIRATLRNFSHTYPRDTRFLLVGPGGQTCLLMSLGGGTSPVTNLTITFDDSAANIVPSPALSGTFKPSPNAQQGASLTSPAPAASYGDTLAAFEGQSAAGAWSLYALDAFSGDVGQLAGGWSLEVTPKNQRGSLPNGLVEGDDGNFYGTTGLGGANGHGTVFKVTPAGEMTTLTDFDATNGRLPAAGLMKDADGSFYGTTSYGGLFDAGTVFSITPTGVLTTLLEFTESENGRPNRGALTRGSDGSLYGTKIGSGGSIYRIIMPGAPLVTNATNTPPGATSAIVQARVNARGSSTVVSMEYWTGGIIPPDPLPPAVPIAAGLNGYQTQLVGTTLTGLTQGTVYYYRFRAVSNAGVSESQVESFSPVETVTTLAEPVAVSLPASNISPTSALLNGTVNARGFESAVFIEWGTDANSFPNRVVAGPATVTGNTAVPVSFALAGLNPGFTYYYRIVASNAGGTVTSGTQSYRTLTPATATVTGVAALSTTRAQVTGLVDTEGSEAQISIEYGTDGINFPTSFAASPSSVSGDLPVEVTATLTGLIQGTTYHARIRAQGPGGTATSASKTFSLSILSGLVQVFPDPPPASDGTVTVNFSPANVGAWRFTGDPQWLNSGVTAGNLETGQRVIEFLPISGFISPPSETLDVTSGGNISLDRVYFTTPTSGSSSLVVRLKPDEFAAPALPIGQRTQWRVVGEPLWRDSGDSLTGLAAGSYLVECKPVAGRETPATSSVSISADQPQEITLTYFTANTSFGSLPLPRSFDDVSANEDLPFAYVGQIRTAVGSSTGFVVKRRVVATAGHVVFDDGTLSTVSGMQWFFQRHTGEHEPRPQTPRGFYLAAGYAAQRTLDNSPGQGSPESQNLDYAALYFVEEAGRGGYGGYLASDSGDDNEFLNSTADKILAGYPVDGTSEAAIGKLHATAPFGTALAPAFGETWTTSAIRGLGGVSGGPLFVRHQSGTYFPAAIYLGGSGQTVVRAIDSAVVELFLRAEVSGNGGSNNTGGGITHTGFTIVGTSTQPGRILVNIEPAAARNANARWGLNPEASARLSGSQRTSLGAGYYLLQLSTVPGFQAPTPQVVLVNAGQLSQVTFTYAANISPPFIYSASNATGEQGQAFSFQVAAFNSPTFFSFTGLLPSGLTFDNNNGLIQGNLNEPGVFGVTLAAANQGGTNTQAFTLTVTLTALNQWRQDNFSTHLNIGDAADSADPDGDGCINIDEYAAGTNPKDNADLFKVLTITQAGGTYAITTTGKTGRSYTLERNSSLTTATWISVTSTGPLTEDGPFTLTDPAALNGAGFYRVRVTTP